MQVCISLQTDNHASTPPLKFFTGRMPFLPPNQQRQSTEGNCIHINYTIYVPTESIWHQQYTGVVRLQIHFCIYAKKQFEKLNCETRAMTSHSQAVVTRQSSKFDII